MEEIKKIVPSAERLLQINAAVEKEARHKMVFPDYKEAIKLALLEIVNYTEKVFGAGIPSWSIIWEVGYKPRRVFMINRQATGQIMIYLERPIERGESKWVRIEDIKTEHCRKINEILNKIGTPAIELLV